VALTRAEEQLYIISSMKLSKKTNEPPVDSMPELFINFLRDRNLFDADQPRYEFGSQVRVSEVRESMEQPTAIKGASTRLDFSNIRIARRESIMWGTPQQDAIEYGNLIHEIMAWVNTSSDVEPMLEKAVAEGLFPHERLSDVRATVASIVNHPDLERHFSSDARILTERAILKPGSDTVKPDRISLYQKEAYLLDYKTGTPLPTHHHQLNAYAETLVEMGFDVVKKTLVYIGEPVNVIHL